jgi:predicted transcriptional regulator
MRVAYARAMLQPNQIKAARALLGLRQADLALRAGIAEITVKALERGSADPRVSTIEKVQSALEKEGIEFMIGGVRLKKPE